MVFVRENLIYKSMMTGGAPMTQETTMLTKWYLKWYHHVDIWLLAPGCVKGGQTRSNHADLASPKDMDFCKKMGPAWPRFTAPVSDSAWPCRWLRRTSRSLPPVTGFQDFANVTKNVFSDLSQKIVSNLNPSENLHAQSHRNARSEERGSSADHLRWCNMGSMVGEVLRQIVHL